MEDLLARRINSMAQFNRSVGVSFSSSSLSFRLWGCNDVAWLSHKKPVRLCVFLARPSNGIAIAANILASSSDQTCELD